MSLRRCCSSTQLVKPNGRICMNCFPLVKKAPLLSPRTLCSFFRLLNKIQIRGTQWICSPKYLFLRPSFAGSEIWKNNMSLEGKCCWAIHNLGCQRGFGVYNSLYILFVYLSFLIEGVNVSHRPLPIAYGRQVAGFRCTLLAGNSSISLTGSEEQIIFSKRSPKMLKMPSESFIYTLLLFLTSFFQIPRWVPLSNLLEN